MSIWDDIAGAFEDLFDYVKQGVEIVVHGIQEVLYRVSDAVETAFRAISNFMSEVADTLKEVGITLSQGIIDGAKTAVNFLETNAKQVIDGLSGSKEYGTQSACNVAMSKAVASVFARIAAEGEEYDVFGLLSIACSEEKKNPELIHAGVIVAVERIGTAIYNIPSIAAAVKKRDVLKDYLAWIINKSATENPALMAGGKAGQAVTGLVIVTMATLLCEGKIAAGAPWTRITGEPDPIDPAAPVVWTEGSRVSIGTGTYLVLDGKVRHIPDPTTYNNLFEDWNNIIKSDPGLQVTGAPLTNGAYLSTAPGDPKVYLVNDGVKRWIASPQVFNKYHFNGKAVRQLSPAAQNAIPTGNPIYQFIRREGSVLKIEPGGGLYLLLDKAAHHIPNPATFNQLFANWNRVQEVHTSSVTIGTPIADGAYLASAEAKVYFVNGNEKRWIMSPIAFNNFNFGWDKIRKVSVADLAKIPEGKSIY